MARVTIEIIDVEGDEVSADVQATALQYHFEPPIDVVINSIEEMREKLTPAQIIGLSIQGFVEQQMEDSGMNHYHGEGSDGPLTVEDISRMAQDVIVDSDAWDDRSSLEPLQEKEPEPAAPAEKVEPITKPKRAWPHE